MRFRATKHNHNTILKRGSDPTSIRVTPDWAVSSLNVDEFWKRSASKSRLPSYIITVGVATSATTPTRLAMWGISTTSSMTDIIWYAPPLTNSTWVVAIRCRPEIPFFLPIGGVPIRFKTRRLGNPLLYVGWGLHH
jgi:hypothetical protein